MLTAVAMTAAGAHLMELPPKMQYEPSLYVRLHRTLYPNFGRVAGPSEAFALFSTATLAWWMRKRRPAAASWAAAAASSLAAAHVLYWLVVQPVNTEMMRWRLDAIPDDWIRWRDRWEYGHAVRAALVTFALGAVTWSLTVNTNDGHIQRPGD
jgi:hypothetical protein